MNIQDNGVACERALLLTAHPNLIKLSSKALLSSSALVLCVAMGATFLSTSSLAQTVVPAGETLVLTEGDVVEYTGGAHVDALKVNDGATVTGTGAIIRTNGTFTDSRDPSNAIYAAVGSTVNLTGGSVSATGAQYTRGIQATGAGTTVTTDGTDISTQGSNSHAVHAHGGALVTINGGEVSTQGSDSFGLYSQNAGSRLIANDVTVITNGTNGFGVFTYGTGAKAEFNDGSITTSGERGHGVVAGLGTEIEIDGAAIETSGPSAVGLIADQANTLITATDTEIETNGTWSHGAHAQGILGSPARIELTGGSITTANETGRGSQDGDGSRSYGLFAEGAGASISADGTSITTLGQRAYGAHALGGAQIDLNDVSISTEGFMAYGIYASGAGSVITANDVDVTTDGQVGDAAWAYNGGRLVLNGGSYEALGAVNPNVPGETVIGLYAGGGLDGVNNGVIEADGVTVRTTGDNAIGLRAGSPIGDANTSGSITFNNGTVTSEGANADAVRVAYGSDFSATGSTLTSDNGIGIRLIDNATVNLTDTTVAAGEESFASFINSAGVEQSIVVGDGSTATANNGTLLRVNREAAGADGVVMLTLEAGSTTTGDIFDITEGVTITGGTDVMQEQDAIWTGQAYGVRSFSGGVGGELNFEGPADISGDLDGNGTTITFSDEGGTIGGDVNLENESSTIGGTIATPINVGGSVFVDNSSTLGGNWDIAGNLTNAGTLSPGNSIGQITIGGNLTLAPTSVYAVEINAAGESDLVIVTGTASLDGLVTVTPLDGFQLGSPYTILTAEGFEGTEFDDVEFDSDYAFIDAFLGYDANNVYLTIERNDVAYSSLAVSANEQAVAGILDDLAITSPLGQAFALSSTADAADAFGQLSGELHASVRTGLMEDSRHIRSGMSDRIGRSAGTEGLAFWAAGFGTWAKHDGDGNAATLNRDTRGVMIGVDTGLGSQGRVGILGGYSTSDMDGSRGGAEVESKHAGIYAGMRVGAFGLRAGAAYSWHKIDTTRTVAFGGLTNGLTTSYDAETAQVFGDISFPIPFSGGLVEPFANVAYVHLNTDDFVEEGGIAALSAGREKSNITFSTVGVRLATVDLLGQPGLSGRASAGWRHAFNDRLPTVDYSFADSDTFAISGVPISKDAAVLDIGLDAALSQSAMISVSYSGQIGDRGVDNGVKASFSLRF